MGFLIAALIASIITGVVKGAVAAWGTMKTTKATEEVFEVQKDRLADEYAATKKRIEDKAKEVAGSQTAIIAASGNLGGEGTVAAGIVGQTEARRSEDQSLLDQTYANALADLEAQKELALTNLEVDYTNTMVGLVTGFVESATSLGLQAGGMDFSQAGKAFGSTGWMDAGAGPYSWGLTVPAYSHPR
jgi:hypothetical protein